MPDQNSSLHTIRRNLLVGASAAALLFTGTAASAQENPDDTQSNDAPTGNEIVVTAQKRAESIQEVPIAITAFSGDTIRDLNLNDVKDLVTFTPGVTGNSQDGFIDTLSMRGILTNDFGVGGDAAIGFFKNGLYQGRNGAVVTSLYDIERGEVLRGPQGFLFGRSAIGGAISVTTTKPQLGVTEGYVELDIGSRSRLIGEAAVNIPAGENFAIRLAGYGAHENGFVDNAFFPDAPRLGGQETYAFRLSGLYEAGPLTAFFTAEYEDRDRDGTVYRANVDAEGFETLEDLFGVSVRGDGRDIDSDLALGSDDDAQVLSFGLQVDYDFGGVIFTSLTGFKDHDYFYAEDFDGTPLQINAYTQDQTGTYFEQELRLVSDTDGPLSWYAGASYFREEIDATFAQQASEDVQCAYYYFAYYGVNTAGSCLDDVYGATAVPEGLLEQNIVNGEYEGWAAYANVNWQFTDTLDLEVGLRYQKETKEFALNALPVSSELGPFFALGFTTDGFITNKASFDAFTPRFVLRYRPNSDVTVFANVSRGYKSGGFGSFSIFPDQPGSLDLTNADARPDQFEPENAWSYELGTKLNLFGGGTVLNANAYFYSYDDLQLTITGQGGGIIVENVGNVEGWGFEASLEQRIGSYFDLRLSGAYAHTSATGVADICDDTLDCEGNRLGHVPEFSGSATLNFSYPLGRGDIKSSVEVFAQSETFGIGSVQLLSEARQSGYADVTFRLGYEQDDWSIAAYVENVTNELYYDGSEEAAGVIPAHFFGPSRPRTFGVQLSANF